MVDVYSLLSPLNETYFCFRLKVGDFDDGDEVKEYASLYELSTWVKYTAVYVTQIT